MIYCLHEKKIHIFNEDISSSYLHFYFHFLPNKNYPVWLEIFEISTFVTMLVEEHMGLQKNKVYHKTQNTFIYLL
jgi:hypothetical protein